MKKEGLPKKELKNCQKVRDLFDDYSVLIDKLRDFKASINIPKTPLDKNFASSYMSIECELDDSKIAQKFFKTHGTAGDLLFWESLRNYYSFFSLYPTLKIGRDRGKVSNPVDGLLKRLRDDQALLSLVKRDLAKKDLLEQQLVDSLEVLKESIDFQLMLEELNLTKTDMLTTSRKMNFENVQMKHMSIRVSDFIKNLFGKPHHALSTRIINFWLPENGAAELEKAVTRYYKDYLKTQK